MKFVSILIFLVSASFINGSISNKTEAPAEEVFLIAEAETANLCCSLDLDVFRVTGGPCSGTPITVTFKIAAPGSCAVDDSLAWTGTGSLESVTYFSGGGAAFRVSGTGTCNGSGDIEITASGTVDVINGGCSANVSFYETFVVTGLNQCC